MAIRNGQKKGAHCHLPTITNANRFVLFMFDYTNSRLTKDFLPYDKNFHSVQARVQFVF